MPSEADMPSLDTQTQPPPDITETPPSTNSAMETQDYTLANGDAKKSKKSKKAKKASLSSMPENASGSTKPATEASTEDMIQEAKHLSAIIKDLTNKINGASLATGISIEDGRPLEFIPQVTAEILELRDKNLGLEKDIQAAKANSESELREIIISKMAAGDAEKYKENCVGFVEKCFHAFQSLATSHKVQEECIAKQSKTIRALKQRLGAEDGFEEKIEDSKMLEDTQMNDKLAALQKENEGISQQMRCSQAGLASMLESVQIMQHEQDAIGAERDEAMKEASHWKDLHDKLIDVHAWHQRVYFTFPYPQEPQSFAVTPVQVVADLPPKSVCGEPGKKKKKNGVGKGAQHQEQLTAIATPTESNTIPSVLIENNDFTKEKPSPPQTSVADAPLVTTGDHEEPLTFAISASTETIPTASVDAEKAQNDEEIDLVPSPKSLLQTKVAGSTESAAQEAEAPKKKKKKPGKPRPEPIGEGSDARRNAKLYEKRAKQLSEVQLNPSLCGTWAEVEAFIEQSYVAQLLSGPAPRTVPSPFQYAFWIFFLTSLVFFLGVLGAAFNIYGPKLASTTTSSTSGSDAYYSLFHTCPLQLPFMCPLDELPVPPRPFDPRPRWMYDSEHYIPPTIICPEEAAIVSYFKPERVLDPQGREWPTIRMMLTATGLAIVRFMDWFRSSCEVGEPPMF